MIVVAMTSNFAQVAYGFILTNADLDEGQLNCPGTVRVDRATSKSQDVLVVQRQVGLRKTS